MKLGKQQMDLPMLIRRNWLDTEMRVAINQLKVEQYAREIKDGANFPSPVVFIDPKDELIRVGDGFHRILARKHNKDKVIIIDLRRGNRRDAFLYGIEVNRQQKGLPFSTGDLEKCIFTLLQDEETSQWTQSKIAQTVGSSIAYTSQVAKKYKDVISRPEIIVDCNGIVRKRGICKEKEIISERKKEAKELFLDGTPKIQIGRKLGISRSAVQRYLEESKMIKCPHCHGTGKIKEIK